jgi:probable HAF family extracellular repeat protein
MTELGSKNAHRKGDATMEFRLSSCIAAMKSDRLMWIAAVAVFAVLAIPRSLAAQDNGAKVNKPEQHHHYHLIDLGTFGGPTSYFSNGADGILNSRGTAVGWSDTSTPDPYPGFCFNPDCFVSHAFQWQSGVVNDLGVLPGGASSASTWISPNGLVAGFSQNGEIDPLIPGLPEDHAVLWRKGGILDLGTLPGGYESQGYAVNSRGQVIGLALNGVPDPLSVFGYQARAFLWQKGAMQDLGTLGGPDAIAFVLNEPGQVTGFSYISYTANSVATPCGANIPTTDPFLWDNGTMLDLGTLGGTCGIPSAINARGQVVGQSDLNGDLTFHPFVWTEPGPIQDLGTLGGDNGLTTWINDDGDIVGDADRPGSQQHDAVLWSDGRMMDLGVLAGDSCSKAYYVNSHGQVVGTSESQTLCDIPTGEHAFLWERGGPMMDLNTLVPPGSSLELTFAFAINDRGEIVGVGVPQGCSPGDVGVCGHAFVLAPCDENHPDIEGCDYSMVDVSTVNSVAAAPRELSVHAPAAPLQRYNYRFYFPAFRN